MSTGRGLLHIPRPKAAIQHGISGLMTGDLRSPAGGAKNGRNIGWKNESPHSITNQTIRGDSSCMGIVSNIVSALRAKYNLPDE